MSNEFHLQLKESVRESSYARYNSYHCDRCDMYIPMHQLSEHVAKKHRDVRFDAHPNSNTDDDGDSMVNSLGRNVTSGNRSTSASASAATVTLAPTVAIVTQTSGDETDFHPFSANLLKKRGLFDDEIDGGAVVTSTPNGTAQNARLTARSMARRSSSFWNGSATGAQLNNGTEKVQNRRRSIPTANQLFDYSQKQNQTEFRSSNFSNFGGSAVDNGGDGGKTRRHAYTRRSISVQRAPVIPENFEACPQCLSVMHQDYMRAHIQRKHRAAATNRNNLITNDGDFSNGNGVADGVDINVGQTDKKTNQPIFVRCKLCSAHMHTNYMPLHIVRKHRMEFDGSAGCIWTECTDSQVNQMLSSSRVYVKNGAFYFNDLE